MNQSFNEQFKCVLLDIEGTTTPIDFVHNRLFPFAKDRIEEFVETHFGELGAEIERLKIEYRKDFTDQIYGRDFIDDSAESVAGYLKFLIDVDRKSTPLKAIQGRIWQAGYETGELQSELFEDVPRAFESWKTGGKTIAIFSSGSRLAQKLIFKYSNFGDLGGLISNYFDTTVGGKKEAESYRKIAARLGFSPSEILFVSDAAAELDAAREAGFETILSIRAGNGIVRQPISHDAVASFEDLLK
jgi:enolase-phosphatase E1